MRMRFCGVFVLLGLCGCSMCKAPWDYADPVQGSPAISYSDTTTRAGSVLNGGGGIASSPTPAPDMPVPEPSQEMQDAPVDDESLTMQPGGPSYQR